MTPAPRFSIVTTCKGRLEHLRQSLPSFLAQPDTEVIVVDYDCPDGTRVSVARDFSAARLVTVDDAPLFNLARARNLGAAVANGEWLAFLDADIVIAPDFSSRLSGYLADRGSFYRFFPLDRETFSSNGSCLIRRNDFAAVEGYDETFDGYGGEDADMYFRLEMSGARPAALDFSLIARIIQHDIPSRIKFGRYPSMLHYQRVNSAYLLVKNSLLRQLGYSGMPASRCRTLYSLVRGVVDEANRTPDAPIHFTVELPADPHFMPAVGWTCKRHIVFDMAPTEILKSDAGHET
jgi:hypothetical protein